MVCTWEQGAKFCQNNLYSEDGDRKCKECGQNKFGVPTCCLIEMAGSWLCSSDTRYNGYDYIHSWEEGYAACAPQPSAEAYFDLSPVSDGFSTPDLQLDEYCQVSTCHLILVDETDKSPYADDLITMFYSNQVYEDVSICVDVQAKVISLSAKNSLAPSIFCISNTVCSIDGLAVTQQVFQVNSTHV